MAVRHLCPSWNIVTCSLWIYQLPTVDSWADTFVAHLRQHDGEAAIRVKRELKSPSQNPPAAVTKSGHGKGGSDIKLWKPQDRACIIKVRIELITTAGLKQIAEALDAMPLHNGYESYRHTEDADFTKEPEIQIRFLNELKQFAA